MKEMLITKEDLEYYSKPEPIDVVKEESVHYGPKKSFEEETKDCITLEEFRDMWYEIIENDPRLI